MHNFSQILIEWYEENKRELPWRGEKSAYKIWISEIILQQTRIEQGRSYYLQFIKEIPTIKALANAKEDEILKLWQGLGYYSRARNLQAGAQFIMTEFHGIFPKKYEDIRKIKGVGDYTAAAIASLAFNLPYAAVDGNVYRVLARIFGINTPINSNIGKKEFQQLAQELLDKQKPGIFNQAMMDFGALQCKPKNPNCENCPFGNVCFAKANAQQNLLPIKNKKIEIKNRYLNYFFIQENNFTYLQKRAKNDIWGGLYEFPLIETNNDIDFESISQENNFKSFFKECLFVLKKKSVQIKHQLTHQKIFARFFIVEILQGSPNVQHEQIKIKIKDLNKFPISRLTELFIEKYLY